MRILITILLSGAMLYKANAQFIAAPSTLTAISAKTNFVKIPGGYLGAKSIVLAYKGTYHWYKAHYSISIVRYDDKMNFVAESKLADGAYSYSPFPPRLLLGDKLWVVYGEPGTKYNMGNIQAMEIDITTLKPLGSKMIASEEEIGIKNANYNYYDFDIRFRNSSDGKYHCLFISNVWDDKFFLACLDSKLKPVWKKNHRILKTSSKEIGNVAIENNGEILVTSVHNDVATLSRYAQSGAAENQTLDFGDSKPQYVDILESQTGQVSIGGTLQKSSKFVNTVFLAKVDQKGSLTSMKKIDIPGSVIEKAKKDRLAYKEGLIGGLLQPELAEQADGGIKMVMECKRVLVQNGEGVFGMVIITDFSATQNQFFVIPKFNVRVMLLPYRNQFVVKPSKNTTTLFYYDNEENLSRSLDDPQKILQGSRDAALFAAVIDNSGTIKRYKVAGNSSITDGEAMNAFMANNQ